MREPLPTIDRPTADRGPTGDERGRDRCLHCGYPIPEGVRTAADATGGRVCSTRCRERLDEEGTSFVGNRAYTRYRTGVAPLDALLPAGVPADALVLLSGDEGARRSELLSELVWRALRRGEPAVVVAFANPPSAVLERFFALEWNVLPDLEGDRLTIIDCFTSRLEDRDGFERAKNEWNRFLGEAAADGVVRVRDPSDVREVANALYRALDDREMTETGVVVIDSLDEIDTLIQDRLIHNFLKDVRASVPKARYVPAFTSATTSGDAAYPADDEYVFDAIVDMRLVDDATGGSRHRHLGVRKCIGAPVDPRWVAFESRGERGLVTVESGAGRRRRSGSDPFGGRLPRRDSIRRRKNPITTDPDHYD